MKKLLLSIFLLSFSFPSFSSENRELFSDYGSVKNISQTQYIAGGLIGFFTGFGIGHAIQGRYRDRGWIFTTGSFLMIAGYSGAVFFGMGAGHQPDNQFISGLAYASWGAGLIGFGIRIWEIVDVWVLPSRYRIVKESPFKIKPLAFYDSNKQLNYGLSLHYQF